MKKSILLGLGAVAMAMGVGAGLTAGRIVAPIETAAEDGAPGDVIFLNLGT